MSISSVFSRSSRRPCAQLKSWNFILSWENEWLPGYSRFIGKYLSICCSRCFLIGMFFTGWGLYRFGWIWGNKVLDEPERVNVSTCDNNRSSNFFFCTLSRASTVAMDISGWCILTIDRLLWFFISRGLLTTVLLSCYRNLFRLVLVRWLTMLLLLNL